MSISNAVHRRYPAIPVNPEYRPHPDSHWVGNLLEIFKRNVYQSPEHRPINDLQRSLTFQELDEGSDHLAALIQESLKGSLEPVILLFDKQVEIAIAMLAAVKAGSVYAAMEPAFPIEHIRSVLNDLQPALVIAHPEFSSVANSLGLPVLFIPGAESNAAPISHFSPPAADPNSPLVVIYTSGSTGRPKGVVIRQFWATYRAQQRAVMHLLSPTDHVVFVESTSFGRGQGSIWNALLNGHRLFMYDLNRSEANGFADWCNANTIHSWSATPSTFRAFCTNLDAGKVLSSMRLVLLGGEMSRIGDFDLFRHHFADSCRLLIGYGMSEAGGIAGVTLTKSDQIDGDTMPVGYPYPGREFFIVNPLGQPASPGELGEVHVRIHQRGVDYLNNPQASNERYYPDPERSGEFICRTGDIGWVEKDGCLYLKGRVDHQIKIRGMKVNTQDVASALDRHSGVKDVYVRGTQDAAGITRLIAYLVLQDDSIPSDEFRRYLEPHLPTHMIPHYFVSLAEIPRSSTGKVDTNRLPIPNGQRPELATPFVAPQTDVEIALATIWSEIIGVKPIGRLDPFVDLGGDSLMAALVFAGIERQLGVSIPPGVLYSAPTIASLAEKIDAGHVTIKKHMFLLPIRSGPITRPVVCFLTPLIGDILAYSEIIQAMRPDISLYGLNSWLLKFRDLKAITLPELAANHIREILTVAPNGPYIFGGHSFAGRLAYEMARQLKAAGHEVPFIFMFDTSGPQDTTSKLLILSRQRLINYLKGMPTWRERWAFVSGKLRNWRRYWMRLANYAHVHLGVNLPRPAGIPIGSDAMREPYSLEPLEIDILYFRANHDLGRFERNPSRGWSELVQGNVETQIVPGDHFSMLRNEAGARIGAHLSEAIVALGNA